MSDASPGTPGTGGSHGGASSPAGHSGVGAGGPSGVGGGGGTSSSSSIGIRDEDLQALIDAKVQEALEGQKPPAPPPPLPSGPVVSFPGASGPGQQVFSQGDIEGQYKKAIGRGQQFLKDLGDPNFLDLVSSAMAAKFEPPPGWERLFAGQGAQQPFVPPQFNPAQYTNPYAQLLSQNVAGAQAAPQNVQPTAGIPYGNITTAPIPVGNTSTS